MPRLTFGTDEDEEEDASNGGGIEQAIPLDLPAQVAEPAPAPLNTSAGRLRERRKKRPIPAFQVVVMWEPPTRSGRGLAAFAPIGETLVDLLSSGEATDVFADASPRGTMSTSGGAASASAPLPRVFAVDAKDERTARQLLEHLTSENPSATVYVAPPRSLQPRNSQARVSGARAAPGPTPPKSRAHWGMKMAGVDALAIDASEVRVAVVDSGVDSAHPDLKDAIEHYENFTGETDRDQSGHGTHVCGIIAARGDPATGMKGVSNAKLLVYKGLGKVYKPDFYFQALQKAVDSKAVVVNLSLGGSDEDPLETVLIRRAIRNGKTVIAAMGNDFELGNPIYYPASIEGVIAVGAVDAALARGSFSNTGPHITLVAPGVKILSTAPTAPSDLFGKQTLLGELDGTSMAAPFVTGVAALLAAQSGTGSDIRAKIRVNPCPGQTPHDEELGWGYLCWTGASTLPP